MRGVSSRFRQPAGILTTAGLLLPLALATTVALAEGGITVIPLKHRLPDELIVTLQPHLQPGETIRGHSTQLILQASPQRQSRLLELIQQMDTARRNLRISVRHGKDRMAIDQQQGISGSWQQGQARIVTSNGSRADPGDVSIRQGGTRNSVTLRSNQAVTTSRSGSDLSLLVLDGGHAMLRVGESLTLVQPWLELAGHRLKAMTAVHVYDVTTGFDVQPRMMGDRIHLTLNPRLVFRTDQGDQIVQFQDLRTEIDVTPREWVDLGGLVERSSEISRQILASRHRHIAEDNRLMVRIDPL